MIICFKRHHLKSISGGDAGTLRKQFDNLNYNWVSYLCIDCMQIHRQ